MADVQPMTVSRFEPSFAGDLDRLVAPPYDVINEDERSRLLEWSSCNVVALDLPQPPSKDDRYRYAAELMREWFDNRILVAEDAPSIWALSQDFTAPDGAARTRNALIARVRVEEYGEGRIRPHERTQPGPKQDRLDLTRATGFNLSPIFSLTTGNAWPVVEDWTTRDDPWATTHDADGTENRLWRIDDPDTLDEVTNALASSELLIADGHHRYETSRVYAAEVGGEGAHRYVLMALTSLSDPGLAVYPIHRLLTGLDSTGLERLERAFDASFTVEEAPQSSVAPEPGDDFGEFGYLNGQSGRALRLRLKPEVDLPQSMPGRSTAYRHLDAAIFETFVLNQILGMSPDDVEAKRGIDYAKSVDQARDALSTNVAQATFLMRPTPMQAVRDVADAGETMPPKSTFFYPKIPTGFVFNPVRNS